MGLLASRQLPGTALLIEETIRQAQPFGDPTLADGTVLITIIDPSGITLVNSAAMTHFSLGRYTYNYAIPTNAVLGIYTVFIVATVGTNSGKISDSFEVVASGE